MMKKKPGPKTRYPDKKRTPYGLCLTAGQHEKLEKAAKRLGIKRADALCELVEQYSDCLELSPMDLYGALGSGS
jgi:hypothetical protein